MRQGTRVEVLSERPEGVMGLRGEAIGTDERGRVQVVLPGFVGYLTFAPSQLRQVDDRPRELKDAERRAMNSSFFVFGEKPKGQRAPKRHRLVRTAEALTEGQLAALVKLLDGSAALITIGGRSYAVNRTPLGWWVQGLGPEDEGHTVSEDVAACSCQDFRFRGHRCKHMEAVDAALVT